MDSKQIVLRALAHQSPVAAQKLLQAEGSAWWHDMCANPAKYQDAVDTARRILSPDAAQFLQQMWEHIQRMISTTDDQELNRLEAVGMRLCQAAPDGPWLAPLFHAFEEWMPDEEFLRLAQLAGYLPAVKR